MGDFYVNFSPLAILGLVFIKISSSFRMEIYQKEMEKIVLEKAEKLENIGWEEYLK